MDLEIALHNEVSQREKSKYCITLFTCEMQKNVTDALICKAEIETGMQITNLPGEKEGNALADWTDTYTSIYI